MDAQRLFAPTADARRLFAPTAFPTEANRKEFAFRSILEALRKHLANGHRTMLDRVLARQGRINARADVYKRQVSSCGSVGMVSSTKWIK